MNDKIKLKICGITKETELPVINRIRPDYIGFVFAESKRKVGREQAEKLRDMLEPGIIAVGVFVDENPDRVVELLSRDIIDIAQLHGNEDEEVITYIKEKTGKPVVKAVIIKDASDVKRWRGTSADYLLLDSGKGSGKTFDWGSIDWSYIKECCADIFLAGGINPDNVAEAVRMVRPYCIDVSSGVELSGMKNEELITKLVRNMEACSLV